MTQSLVNIRTEASASNALHKAVEVLKPEAMSRVFVTGPHSRDSSRSYSVAALTNREYSQTELCEMKEALRQHVAQDNLDLVLQVSGDWIREREAKCFEITRIHVDDWMKKGWVAFPTSDLIRSVILPDRTLQLTVPRQMLSPWLQEIEASIPVEKMPLVSGHRAHHEAFMDQLLSYLQSEWKAPDSPIAAMLIHNGRVVGQA